MKTKHKRCKFCYNRTVCIFALYDAYRRLYDYQVDECYDYKGPALWRLMTDA